MAGPAFDLHLFTPPIRERLAHLASVPLPLSAAQARAAAPLPESDTELLRLSPETLFPNARDPKSALSGLLLRLGQWEASHEHSQNIAGREGSYWHAIAHRMEPDSANAAYWFRRVGDHPIFPELHARAAALLEGSPVRNWTLPSHWDPFRFIEWCDQARRLPGSPEEQAALAIQKAEWESLFVWCARAPS